MLLTICGANLKVHEEGKSFADPLEKHVHQLSMDRKMTQQDFQRHNKIYNMKTKCSGIWRNKNFEKKVETKKLTWAVTASLKKVLI